MNTELLRTFLEVSKTRHFGHAAENLHLTQSAVSFRIKQLEDSIGTALFTRSRNNILLTPSGERMLPHAENILAAWQFALQDVGVAEEKDLQLALGGSSNLWDTFLQSLLPKIAAHFPGLHIRTEINSAQELTRALLGGRLDIAVLLDPPKVAGLEVAEIGKIELVLTSSTPRLDRADLSSAGYIFVDWGTSVNFQQAKMHTTPAAPVLHTGQSHIALEFMLTHGGVAFLPRALVAPHLENSHLFLISDVDSIMREVYAVYPSDSPRSDHITPIVSMLQRLELKPSAPFSEAFQD
jgi:DNA-binding transcriptional LysR family regulator